MLRARQPARPAPSGAREEAVIEILTIETPELGDRSYLVHDGAVALVVDPQRDIDRVLALASEAGVRIEAIAETHMHNDYVTGGLALAAETGARYLVNAADPVSFEREEVRDGDRIGVGSFTVEVLATPGHTPNHLSYLVYEGDRPTSVFTGGSLLFGTVGRTDLISAEQTEPLTRAQYRSAHRLAELPGSVEVLPTHGFGSFCSSASTSGSSVSTIDQERQQNLALTLTDEDTFVKTLLSGLTAYPRYYAYMGERNLAGPGPVRYDPPAPVDPEELGRRIEAGEWVVDLRDRRAYAKGHLSGTVGIELGSLFSTYHGWVVPWGEPVTLIGERPEDVERAQRDLSRIGIDELAGAAVGPVEHLAGARPLSSYEVTDFAGLASRLAAGERWTILDVRRDDEREVAHIEHSMHIPVHDLRARLGEVPDGPVAVHCAAGFRSAIGASLLDGGGRQILLVDDDFSRATDAGLPVVS